MKLDLLKLVDILAVAAVALAWSHPVWAQAQDDAAVAACLEKSRAVKADSPLAVVQAQKDAFDACVASSISDPQRRTLALRKNVEFVCNDTANIEQTRDSLTTAERAKVYGRCLKGHGYVQ